MIRPVYGPGIPKATGLLKETHYRHRKPIDPLDSPYVQESLARFEENLGGREAILSILLTVPHLSAEVQFVLGLLGDPANRLMTLPALCKLGGLLPSELIGAIKIGVLGRAQVESLAKVAEHLPAVAADVMRRAKPYEQTCPRCNGTQTVVPKATKAVPNPEPAPCPDCNGVGTHLVDADIEHQKLALELGELKKPAGVKLGIAMAFNERPGPASLGAIQAATDRLLYGTAESHPDSVGDSVEGEVVAEPEADGATR